MNNTLLKSIYYKREYFKLHKFAINFCNLSLNSNSKIKINENSNITKNELWIYFINSIIKYIKNEKLKINTEFYMDNNLLILLYFIHKVAYKRNIRIFFNYSTYSFRYSQLFILFNFLIYNENDYIFNKDCIVNCNFNLNIFQHMILYITRKIIPLNILFNMLYFFYPTRIYNKTIYFHKDPLNNLDDYDDYDDYQK